MSAEEELVEKVMTNLETYFMGNDENSAEAMFDSWAANHADKFADGFEWFDKEE